MVMVLVLGVLSRARGAGLHGAVASCLRPGVQALGGAGGGWAPSPCKAFLAFPLMLDTCLPSIHHSSTDSSYQTQSQKFCSRVLLCRTLSDCARLLFVHA